MKQPTSAEEIRTLHNLLRSDPQKYLQIVSDWIDQDPTNADAYFDRHFAWMRLGQSQRALDDLNKVIELEREVQPIVYMSRGEVHRHLQEFSLALHDFDHGEAINPDKWANDIVFGLLFQADAHAHLGNEAAALSCCARLPDDFWTPGIAGAPRGNKTEITEQLRRIAADARRRSPDAWPD